MTEYPSPLATPRIRMLETRLELNGHSVPAVVLRSAHDVAGLLQRLIADLDRECFVALFLNARHVVTHVHLVSQGTTQQSLVHPREVFKGAILANASALVTAHNHPSGDVEPSAQDASVTQRLRDAGELLGIELLDSVIVGPCDRFHSSVEGTVRFARRLAAKEVADGPE